MLYSENNQTIINKAGEKIFSSKKPNVIKTLLKRMNNGSGFNGLDPDFFKEETNEQ